MNALAIGRRTVRAAWNGPFHIGPLARPASVGDVLLKLLETTWRAAFIAALTGGAVWSAVEVSGLWAEPYKPLEEQVEFTVQLPSEICTEKQYPMFVGVVNRSAERIGSVSFTVHAYQEGKSTDWAAEPDGYVDDTILKPGEGAGYCYERPRLRDGLSPGTKLVYQAKATLVSTTALDTSPRAAASAGK